MNDKLDLGGWPEILRQVAKEIRENDLPGWGNTCADAADAFEAQSAEVSKYKPFYDAVDDEAVTTWTLDSKLLPKEQLAAIIDWHIQVATDPTVNGGYELKPDSGSPEPEKRNHIECKECGEGCRFGGVLTHKAGCSQAPNFVDGRESS